MFYKNVFTEKYFYDNIFITQISTTTGDIWMQVFYINFWKGWPLLALSPVMAF